MKRSLYSRYLLTIILALALIRIPVYGNEISRPAEGGMLNEAPVAEVSESVIDAELTDGDSVSDDGIVYRTEEEISEYLKKNPVDLHAAVSYKTKPSLKAPYEAGQLSDETLNSALRLVKNIRYIAGLSDNVVLNDEYTARAQAGSLVNAVNDELSHTPNKPANMSEDLYQLGYEGTSHSNIGFGYGSVNGSIIDGYMDDSDSSNIDRLGHRRWILYPGLTETGFGYAGRYTATYVIGEESYIQYPECNIAWPAREMPVDYFTDTAWSLSTGEVEDISKITVTLTREKDKKSWTFKGSGGKTDDGYFNVNNDGYGCKGGIIFHPSGISKDKAGEIFHVEITGTSKGTISYDVHFFEPGFSSTGSGQNIIAGQKIDIKNKYFSGLSGIAKYRLSFTEGGEGKANKYAKVSRKGILNAKKPAGITIVPQYKNGNTLTDFEDQSVSVDIIGKPGIKIDEVFSETGKTISFYDYDHGYGNKLDIKPVKFTSSKPSVATIDDNGVITIGSGDGKTVIKAYYSIKGQDHAANTVKVKTKITVKH